MRSSLKAGAPEDAKAREHTKEGSFPELEADLQMERIHKIPRRTMGKDTPLALTYLPGNLNLQGGRKPYKSACTHTHTHTQDQYTNGWKNLIFLH